jgi:hypothetical protein
MLWACITEMTWCGRGDVSEWEQLISSKPELGFVLDRIRSANRPRSRNMNMLFAESGPAGAGRRVLLGRAMRSSRCTRAPAPTPTT